MKAIIRSIAHHDTSDVDFRKNVSSEIEIQLFPLKLINLFAMILFASI